MWNADCGMRIENYKNQPRKHEIYFYFSFFVFLNFRAFVITCLTHD
jgi:hypothetical protein